MISFANIALSLPTPRLKEVLQRFDVSMVRNWTWRDSYAVPPGIPPFDAPEPLKPELNVLQWPVSPTRWAYGHFLATGSQLAAIRAAVSSEAGGYGTLQIDDGTDIVSMQMKLVQAYPIFQVKRGTTTSTSTSSTTTDPFTTTTCPNSLEDEDLYILTFVDRRYYWWYREAPNFDTCKSWTELFAQVASLLGITITVETVPTEYETPSARWSGQNWSGYPLALYLESAARFIGARVVCRIDGDVVIQRPGKRQTDLDELRLWNYKRIFGGELPVYEALAAMPEAVRVVFYDTVGTSCSKEHTIQDVLLYPFTRDAITATTTTATAPRCSTSTTTSSTTTTTTTTTSPFCVNQETTVPQTSALIWADKGVEAGQLTDILAYANRIGFDWYLWHLPSISAVFFGVVNWTLSGLSDRLEFRHTDVDFDTRVYPATLGIDNMIAPGVLCDINCETTGVGGSTSNPGCSGHCVWTINETTHEWELTSTTCVCPCECAPPTKCPDPALECANTKTPCVIYPKGAPSPPSCTTTTTDPLTTSTTSTTTTTTIPAGCDSFCTWYRDASGNTWRYIPSTNQYWSIIDVRARLCAKDGVEAQMCGICAYPEGQAICTSVTTPCVLLTTSTQRCVDCGGACSWVWDPAFGLWLNNTPFGSNCNPGNCAPGNCTCDQPTEPGDFCAQYQSTPCYLHEPPDILPLPTSTTSPETTCGNGCLWTWLDNELPVWTPYSVSCFPGCFCPAPTIEGDDECSVAWTPCNPLPPGTTTTSTTTTTTTTTTTCPCDNEFGCLQYCHYEVRCACDGTGALLLKVSEAAGDFACDGDCGCPDPTYYYSPCTFPLASVCNGVCEGDPNFHHNVSINCVSNVSGIPQIAYGEYDLGFCDSCYIDCTSTTTSTTTTTSPCTGACDYVLTCYGEGLIHIEVTSSCDLDGECPACAILEDYACADGTASRSCVPSDQGAEAPWTDNYLCPGCTTSSLP